MMERVGFFEHCAVGSSAGGFFWAGELVPAMGPAFDKLLALVGFESLRNRACFGL
jgi:hypothetical protein